MFYSLLVSFFLSVLSKPVKPVLIGGKVPNLVIKNVINYKSDQLNLAALKGKLVIFDFGNTGCPPCIKMLPEMDELKRKFGNKIEIIWVIPDNKSKALNFLKKNPRAKNLRIPVIYGDTILHQLFPHRYFPFECWIDSAGKVIARTEAGYVTEENIAKLLKGEKVDFVNRIDNTVKLYDRKKPLLSVDSTNIPSITKDSRIPTRLLYSAITNYQDGVYGYGSREVDSINNYQILSFVNSSILSLYQRFLGSFATNRIISNDLVKLSSEFRPSSMTKDEWDLRYLVCYQAVLPLKMSTAEVEKKFQYDVESFFGYHVNEEYRNTEVWVVKKAPQFETQWSNALKVTPELRQHAGDLDMHTLDEIVRRLDWSGQFPTIDETGLSREILTGFFLKEILKKQDYNSVSEKLSNYGLTISKEMRQLRMFVFNER